MTERRLQRTPKSAAPKPAAPTGEEIAQAIEEHRVAVEANKAAYNAMMKARERLVDVLHRAGVEGFHL